MGVGRVALRGRGGGGVEKAPFTTLAYDDPIVLALAFALATSNSRFSFSIILR